METSGTFGHLLVGVVTFSLFGGLGVFCILRPERLLKNNSYYRGGGEMLRDLYVLGVRIFGAIVVVFVLHVLVSIFT